MCFERLKSSIGRKSVVAVSGIFLFLFVVAHMLGNLQIFLGPEALNSYAEHLKSLPFLLWPARIFLLLTLIIHMGVSISLAIDNRKARPVGYAYKKTVQASTASLTMVVSGMIVFLFIVYHLLHFTFGATHPQFFELVDPQGRQDVYSMVILSFREVWVSVSYVIAMAVLCVHLSHGFQSFFQSLGFNNEKNKRCLRKAAVMISTLIFIGNASVPLAAFFGFLKPLGSF